MRSHDAHSFRTLLRGVPISDTTTPTASVWRAATSLMSTGCAMATSTDVTRSQNVPWSQGTQATVTTCTIGTQSAGRSLISSSSQTWVECSDLQVDDVQAGASLKRLPASRACADITAEAGPPTGSCCPQSGNTGSFSNDSNETQFGENVYSCLSCRRRNQVTTRVKVGAVKRPYLCTVCKRAFNVKCNMQSHMRVHTGERPYVCSVCQKGFKQRHHLARHGKLHSGERPYVCNICQKNFTQRCNLVRHERVHSVEKLYLGGISQKSFTTRIHLVTYDRLRAYVCCICQKSFIRKDELISHERSHSG